MRRSKLLSAFLPKCIRQVSLMKIIQHKGPRGIMKRRIGNEDSSCRAVAERQRFFLL